MDEWKRISNGDTKILTHYSLLKEPTGTLKGKTALRAYFAKALEKYPDLKFHLLKVFTSVQSVTLSYKCE